MDEGDAMNDWEPHCKALRALVEELAEVSALGELLAGQGVPPDGSRRTVRDVADAIDAELSWFRDAYKEDKRCD